MLEAAVHLECQWKEIPATFVKKVGSQYKSRKGTIRLRICTRTGVLTIEANNGYKRKIRG